MTLFAWRVRPDPAAAVRPARISALVVCVWLVVSVAANAAPDAYKLTRKMVTTYKAMKTFQETSEAKITLLNGRQIYQSNSIKYMAPALFTVVSMDPNAGTMACYSNSRGVTLFSGKQNIYSKRTTPLELKQRMADVERLSADLTGTTFVQTMNAISFMTSGDLPKEVSTLRYAGKNTINGIETYHIAAEVNRGWMQKNAPKGFKPQAGEIAIYMDARTNLLVRCAIRLIWTMKIPPRKKEPAKVVTTGYLIEETHQGMEVDKPIKETTFDFLPPKGSTEIYREHK